MRRALSALVVVAIAVGAMFATGAGSSTKSGTDYWVQLDNAFGLIEGADVKVGGVRAGKITEMDIDRSQMRALVGIDITRKGFDDFHTDAFCETRPQSLIGEYFVDCQPGSVGAQTIKRGGILPVERTASTVPVDLVNSIMRRPYRERLSILLSELGAGLAARGEDIDVTVRRAVPALRATDVTLAKLARQRRTIRDLNDDADKVLKALADARSDVTRFVHEAGDTAEVSASRSRELKAQFQQLPGFLHELQPTMRALGTAAGEQAPALRTLAANSARLQTFLGALGDFSMASRPSVKTLAAAARQGRPAVLAAGPQVRRLNRAVKPLPELAGNAAPTFEALDDPARAVEKDPRSPRNGAGYTGLEALLRYIWAQGQATNIYDGEGHILKVSAFIDAVCAFYADAAAAKKPDHDRCAATLGPTRPGINTPDPTATAQPAARKAKRKPAQDAPAAPPATAPATTTQPAPATADQPGGGIIDELLDGVLDKLKPITGGGGQGTPPPDVTGLLDYILGNGGGR